MFVVVVVIGYEVVGTKENKLHYNILQFSPSFQCWVCILSLLFGFVSSSFPFCFMKHRSLFV